MFACRSLGPEEVQDSKKVLTATFEALPASKTALSPAGGGAYKVFWTKDDKISVIPEGQTLPCLYYLSSGEGTATGQFSGYGSGNSYIAWYPGTGPVSLAGSSELSVVFPTEQAYTAGTFADNVCPMVASGTGSELAFRNVASVLKVSLTGRHSVTRLVFRAKDSSMKISGPATVSVADPSKPVLTISDKGCDSIFVNTGVVNLTEDKATDFYLVLPPMTCKGGFTVRIWTNSGYMDKVYGSDFTFERSRVHEATPVKVKLTNGVEASESLDGLGTPEQPFKIGSLSDLLLMQAAVNTPGARINAKSGGSVEAISASFLMTADIDLSAACGKASGVSWTPIGSEAMPFLGSFDGGGHKISNLYINAPEQDYQGFFGNISGNLSNVKLDGTIETAGRVCALLAANSTGSIRNCETSGSVVVTGSYSGGIAAIGLYFYNCINHADVSTRVYKRWTGGIAGEGFEFYDCYNDGTIRGDYTAGGICGYCTVIVSGCINRGITDARGHSSGGIVGETDGSVVNCINYGRAQGVSRAGGLVGEFRGPLIANCVNYGIIFVTSDTGGGIAGFIGNKSNGETHSEIRNCVSTGEFTNYDVLYGYTYDSFKDRGALCGITMGRKAGKDYLGNEYQDSSIEYSYWLYDKTANLGWEIPIGTENGTSSHIFPLDQAAMKGADSGQALYKTHTRVVDALNAWVADNPKFPETNIEFKTWQYDSATGYPILKQ